MIKKYTIIDNHDISRYLGKKQQYELEEILRSIETGRLSERKLKTRAFLVLDENEPYMYEIMDLLYEIAPEVYREVKDSIKCKYPAGHPLCDNPEIRIEGNGFSSE